MLIRWRGFGVRVVGPYQWSPENGYVCDVLDVGMVQELLTSPVPDRFEIAPGDPLLQKVGSGKAEELVLRGIIDVDMADLFHSDNAATGQATDVGFGEETTA